MPALHLDHQEGANAYVRTSPRPPMSSSEWRDRAACRGRPTRWWFARDRRTQIKAVAICQRCPVRSECLADALETDALAFGRAFGIRGGRYATERDRLREAADASVAS